jgi:AbrB family looped-hinge helix DNA binding protein
MTITVTSKGQVTIPKQVHFLGIGPGSEFMTMTRGER